MSKFFYTLAFSLFAGGVVTYAVFKFLSKAKAEREQKAADEIWELWKDYGGGAHSG